MRSQPLPVHHRVSAVDLHPPGDATSWLGLEFQEPEPRGAGAPALHVEYASHGLFRVRFCSRTLLVARLVRCFGGLLWVRTPGEPASLNVIPPIRATECRELAGDLRGWAWRFHDELDASAATMLYPGTWRLEPPPASEPSFGGYPRIRRLDQCLSASSGLSNWDINGSGDVCALRQPSAPDAARVKAWRKAARDGSLPPVLLFFVSAMDSWLLVDGHDRLQAALLEGVKPPVLSLSSCRVRRWTHDHEATVRIERGLERQLQHARVPERIDAVNRRLIELHAEPSCVVPRTRAWPIPGGRDGWAAEARDLVAAGAPVELVAGGADDE